MKNRLPSGSMLISGPHEASRSPEVASLAAHVLAAFPDAVQVRVEIRHGEIVDEPHLRQLEVVVAQERDWLCLCNCPILADIEEPVNARRSKSTVVPEPLFGRMSSVNGE